MKQNKAITLIALIITIIIILILAGVSVNIILGQNGLLNNSKYAVENYMNAQQREEYELAKAERLINNNRETSLNVDEELANWLATLGEPVTIDNLLNDEILDRLLNNNDSINYMLNSNVIRSKVIGNSYALKKVADNKNAISKVIENANWTGKILNSDSAIATLKTSSNLVTVPKLTANNENVLYSSQYNDSDTFGAYKAFDGSATASSALNHWTSKASTNQYIGYKFGEPVWVFQCSISPTTDGDGGALPKDATLQASNDGINWSDISSKKDIAKKNGKQFIQVNNYNQRYQYWRLFFNEGWYSEYIGVAEIEFYGLK